MANTCYYLRDKDTDRRMIFVESLALKSDLALLSRMFREIERDHYKTDRSKPWRIIYKDSFGFDYEITLADNSPFRYQNWDRRYNPQIKTQRWHGHMWDALKGVE